MKFGSLFSGIGGFDLGFEQAGLTSEWQVEIDKDCTKVLANRFPNVSRFTDVKNVGKLPTVDVICGGFPCQDLSVVGKRKGLAGERSGLWFEFLRIIESNLPRWIVIENVPGLLSSDEGRDFAAILRGLVNVGYCLAWRVLDAQYDGVAQRRRRVFIVGSLGDGSCAQILFESESVSWNPPTRGEARAGVASAVTTGTGKSSGPRNGNGDPLNLIAATLKQRGRGACDEVMDNLQVARPLANSRTTNHYDESQQTYVTHALRSEGADASEDGTGRGTPLIVAEAVDVRNLRMQPDGTSGTLQHKKSGGYSLNYQNPVLATAYRTAGNCGPFEQGDKTGALNTNTDPSQNIIAFSSKDHGADAGAISPTLRAQNFKDSHINGGGQVAIAFHENKSGQLSQADVLGVRAGASHSYQGVGESFGVRRLTPRECMRLQGFPDSWFDGTGLSDSAMYRCLGNAVAVPVAKWIGRRLLRT